MKKLTENLRQNWPTYFFEILVLIIGIYGAFALEAWNENRKERKLETKYLKSLAIDLKRDLEQLDDLKRIRNHSNETALRLLNTESLPNTYEAQKQYSEDSKAVHFWHEFNPNDNTFKELTNSGNLSLFEDDSVKIRLLNLATINDYIITARNHMRREYDEYLYDELAKYEGFGLYDFDHMVKVQKMDIQYLESLDDAYLDQLTSETNLLLHNKQIRYGWKLSILNSSAIIQLYDKMITEIHLTLKAIDKSLEER